MSGSVVGRVAGARLALMLDQPHLAPAVARYPMLDVSDEGWCEVAATDGYHVFVHVQELEKHPTEQIAFVLAHEVLHNVLGHHDRRGARDAETWNFAIDYAVNLMLVDLGMTMLPGGLLERSYAGMTAEQIYEILAKRRAGRKGGSRSARPGAGAVAAGRDPDARASGACGFDQHLDPADARAGAQRSPDFPSRLERARLREALTQEMRSRGTLPGSFSEEIRAEGIARVPWESVVARFVSGLRYGDYRLYPFHRKHIWRGLYLPSPGVPGPQHLVVAVDTSASMPSGEIARILTEIDALRGASECRLTLLQFDAAVQKVETYEAFEEPAFCGSSSGTWEVKGRGGTRFEPVFEWVGEQAKRGESQPDAVIVCTDGSGSFPSSAPEYPVMWISTASGPESFPFGEYVNLRA